MMLTTTTPHIRHRHFDLYWKAHQLNAIAEVWLPARPRGVRGVFLRNCMRVCVGIAEATNEIEDRQAKRVLKTVITALHRMDAALHLEFVQMPAPHFDALRKRVDELVLALRALRDVHVSEWLEHRAAQVRAEEVDGCNTTKADDPCRTELEQILSLVSEARAALISASSTPSPRPGGALQATSDPPVPPPRGNDRRGACSVTGSSSTRQVSLSCDHAESAASVSAAERDGAKRQTALLAHSANGESGETLST